MKVVVAGHICLDMIPDWRRGGMASIIPGHILEMDGITLATGGAVANTGLALTKLGVEATLVGKIGDDALGSMIQSILARADQSLAESMIIHQGATSSYTIVLNPPDTDRFFLHYPGPNQTLKARDIPFGDLRDTTIFHFGYPPILQQFYQRDGQELIEVMGTFREMGSITSLDMSTPDAQSPAGRVDWKRYLERALPYVDLFLPSIDEILYMLEIDEELLDKRGSLNTPLLQRIANQLLGWGSKLVMLKLGERGLYLKSRALEREERDHPLLDLAHPSGWENRELLSPSFQVEVVGTTGAGDATIAGFLAKLLEGSSLEEALTIAAAVGAFSVEAMDATSGIRDLKEAEERIGQGWEQQPLFCHDHSFSYDPLSRLYIHH